ncbi:unnamed protein product [Hermetia illucens]|uniref:BHLH domain-containing protein n=2 Tax=Hermetia illucens TaxID=343691 RepID=A0A7R8Z0A6_HERIL|nr:unnamed protein product [Hermetia illucens]
MSQNCVLIASQNYLPIAQQTQLAHQHSGQTQVSVKQANIAPAPPNHNNRTVLGMNGINVGAVDAAPKYKRKYNYTNMPYGQPPPSVARRNARERNRVKQVNNGFTTLRQHIPDKIINALTNGGRGASKKLSKVDTLRLAVEYIRRLQDILDETDQDSTSTLRSQTSSPPLSGSPCSYYTTSPDHFSVQTPCSETSSSPTPSYSSDISIGNSGFIQSEPQFKFEHYDSYSTIKPEDEELLDYISSWQEQ